MVDVEHARPARPRTGCARRARRASSRRCQTAPTKGSDLRRDLAQLRRAAPRRRSPARRGRAAARCGAAAARRPSLASVVGIGEVADADGAAADLVLVGRADAAAGGADLARPPRASSRSTVELAVQRQDQRGVLGEQQVLRRDRHALLAQRLDLRQQRPGIDHHAVADDRQLARPHHARGQQAQLVGRVADDQRVAGIVAALEAHHDVGALGQPVDDLALALVAPLGADHRHIRHACSSPRFYARPASLGRRQTMGAAEPPRLGRGLGDGLEPGDRDPALRRAQAAAARPRSPAAGRARRRGGAAAAGRAAGVSR